LYVALATAVHSFKECIAGAFVARQYHGGGVALAAYIRTTAGHTITDIVDWRTAKSRIFVSGRIGLIRGAGQTASLAEVDIGGAAQANEWDRIGFIACEAARQAVYACSYIIWIIDLVSCAGKKL
jgi:hypothetical protein